MKRRQSLLPAPVWTPLLAASCMVALLMHPAVPSGYDFFAFGLLAALAIIAPYVILEQRDAPLSRFDAPTLFVFAGALLLPPILIVLLSLAPTFAEWLGVTALPSAQQRDPRARPLVAAARLLSGLAVGLVLLGLQPSDLPSWLIALVLAATIFLVVQRIFRLVTRLALREGGDSLLHPTRTTDLIGDILILSLGGAVAVLWIVNAWLVLPALFQLLLIYRVSQIPRLEKQAQTDAKTGLWNARHLDILFRTEIERAARFERPLSVMMADLDLMRNINNHYGHLAGDNVLRGIGDVIRRSLREYDIAARFGGEEFVIVLPETGEAEAALTAERLREAVASEGFGGTTNFAPIHATMSIGVASFPWDARTAAGLLRSADRALYSAKAEGRNRVALASRAPEPSPDPGSVPEGLDVAKPSSLASLLTILVPATAQLHPPVGGERRVAPNLAWAALLLVCGLVSGSTVVLASEHALPGDSLYPLKTGMENAQLAFTSGEGSKAAFELDLARRRYLELSALVEAGRDNQLPTAALAFSQEIERAAQSLALLRSDNPTLAASLTRLAALEWTGASEFLQGLRGNVPANIESSIALTLAVVESQTALLEANAAGDGTALAGQQAPPAATPEPNLLPVASAAPAPMSESPVPVPIGSEEVVLVSLVTTPAAPTVRQDYSKISDLGGASGAVKGDVVRSRPQAGGAAAPLAGSKVVVQPGSVLTNLGAAQPTKGKKPIPICSNKSSCKAPTPPSKNKAEMALPKDWARQFLMPSARK